MSFARLPEPFLLSSEDSSWPPRLADLPDPPTRLVVRGTLPSWDRPIAAIVGTRRTDSFGREFTRNLARELAERGWLVVSGGARGIDTEAHLGALEGKGVTLAVLPTGLDRPYPERNAALFARI